MTLTPAALGTLANNWLGRSNYSADPVFAGAFDEFNVWSRALTAAEITSLQTARAAAPRRAAATWPRTHFDETTGGTFADASGRGLHRHAAPHLGRARAIPGSWRRTRRRSSSTLESMTSPDYTMVWAPYYTAHKILRGLLDAYSATDDARALDLASGLCDWMYSRLSKLPEATLQRMWGIFSSGEFGGIVEAIVDLYAITGKGRAPRAGQAVRPRHTLIDACAANTRHPRRPARQPAHPDLHRATSGCTTRPARSAT